MEARSIGATFRSWSHAQIKKSTQKLLVYEKGLLTIIRWSNTDQTGLWKFATQGMRVFECVMSPRLYDINKQISRWGVSLLHTTRHSPSPELSDSHIRRIPRSVDEHRRPFKTCRVTRLGFRHSYPESVKLTRVIGLWRAKSEEPIHHRHYTSSVWRKWLLTLAECRECGQWTRKHTCHLASAEHLPLGSGLCKYRVVLAVGKARRVCWWHVKTGNVWSFFSVLLGNQALEVICFDCTSTANNSKTYHTV